MDDEMMVDINRASIDELAQISGIGEKLAARIIEYRETVHPFEELIELAAVPGISERMVREFGDQLTVEPMAVMERTAVLPSMRLEPVEDPETEETVTETGWVGDFMGRGDEETAVADAGAEEPAAEIEAEEPVETPEVEPIEDLVEEIPDETASEEVDEEVEEITDETAEEITEEAPIIEPAAGIAWPEPLAPTAEPIQFETPEPEPEPEPAPSPVAAPAPKPQRMLGTVLLGSILGAFVGVVLTLAVLAALNGGTLRFAQADSQLQVGLDEARQAQTDLSQELDGFNNEFSADMDAIGTRTSDMAEQQTAVDQSLQSLERSLANTQGSVAELEKVTEALDERLTTVAAAAETFDTFLNGLRDLLIDLQGTPVPTMTPYADKTPDATLTATIEPEVTATPEPATGPEATATGRPTRTPRPTATAILPTSTPSQQP